MKIELGVFQKYFDWASENSRELTFSILGALMFIVIIWYLISDISFLVDSFNSAFNPKIEHSSSQSSFHLDEAQEVLGN